MLPSHVAQMQPDRGLSEQSSALQELPSEASRAPHQPMPGKQLRHECSSGDTNHNIDPALDAEEDSVPPIGDECQLPCDFAQGYGITAIRVLTTFQAPAW
jgi:hypothetical protein